MTHAVFISHSAKDPRLADAVCGSLERRSVGCWIAPRDIIPGRSWGESIVEAIDGSQAMVVVLTANANRSRHVVKEVERAESKGVPIIPFRAETVTLNKSLEYFLSAQHWLDAVSRPIEPHLDTLARTVERLLAGTDSAGLAAEAQRLPHRPARPASEVIHEFNELPPDDWGAVPGNRLGTFFRRLFAER
jgi:hypothetical protein